MCIISEVSPSVTFDIKFGVKVSPAIKFLKLLFHFKLLVGAHKS